MLIKLLRLVLSVVMITLITALSVVAVSAEEDAESEAPFIATCEPGGRITIEPVDGTAFSISASEVSQGIREAIASGQSALIIIINEINVLALPSNSVQLLGVDGYSLIIPLSSCETSTLDTSSEDTTSDTATVDTTDEEPVSSETVSCDNIPDDAVDVHIVQAGENLFRIGLRYGVHYSRLASYNGIPDASRIFVDQCIAIPPD